MQVAHYKTVGQLLLGILTKVSMVMHISTLLIMLLPLNLIFQCISYKKMFVADRVKETVEKSFVHYDQPMGLHGINVRNNYI